MKRVISAVMACLLATPVAFADNREKIDDAFFEELKLGAIEEEIRLSGIDLEKQSTFTDILSELKHSDTSVSKVLIESIQQLHEYEYIHMTKDGEIYSSEEGYLGMADEMENDYEEAIISDDDIEYDKIIPTALNPSEISGGSTGAFSRKQLVFRGYDGIISDVTLPKISHFIDKENKLKGAAENEQPWVYYGFDSMYGHGVEGGFSYQTGKQLWKPYIRAKVGDQDFEYEPNMYFYNDGDTLHDVKFYLKNVNEKVYSYFFVGSTPVVLTTETPFKTTELSKMSVKRCTSIASNFTFDGENILTISEDQKWGNVRVSTYNNDYYNSWPFKKENAWKLGTKVYGTVNCTISYVRSSEEYTSIFKEW